MMIMRFGRMRWWGGGQWWWTPLWGFWLTNCFMMGLGAATRKWGQEELDRVEPSPEMEFQTFPGIVLTSWQLALVNKSLGNTSITSTTSTTSDPLGQLTKGVCQLIFIAESRVHSCWLMRDGNDGGDEEAPYVLSDSPSRVQRDSNVRWIAEVDLGHKELAFVWTKFLHQKSLGYVQKVFQGRRSYRIGLKVPFKYWFVDPCAPPNADLLCDPISTKCISGGESNVLNTNFSCECLEWYVPRSENESSSGGEPGKCARGDWLTRDILLIIQVVAILVAIGIAIATFAQRKTKVMSSSMWPVTEVIVIGSILLYLTILLRSMDQPSNAVCIVEPWLRELGFSLCYGAIVLKIYRALVEFRTRKAHRWVVREKDILRYLSAIFAVVIFYMTAWTVTNSIQIPYADHVCPITWWHRVTEIGELLFLGVGLHMAYHLRNAQAPWNERRYYSAALLIETFVSIVTIILRESRVYITTNESLFLMVLYFARSHVATTVILLVVFVPKFYYIQDEKKKRLVRRSDGGTTRVVKALDAINGDLDLAEVNLADMDPQDIRQELKRVYTQLELLRNKTMRKDNPHISKRRGGRKPTHRRFSLQALHRRNQRSFRYHGDDIEDSVCSIEGPSTYSEAGR